MPVLGIKEQSFSLIRSGKASGEIPAGNLQQALGRATGLKNRAPAAGASGFFLKPFNPGANGRKSELVGTHPRLTLLAKVHLPTKSVPFSLHHQVEGAVSS